MRKSSFLLCGIFLAAAAAGGLLAEEEASDDLVQVVSGLLSEKDKDLRAVGLGQVREQVKGSAATQQFAALLPKLPVDAQVGLLDALADRGDDTAGPAVRDMLNSRDEQVRAAALRALGPLGETADVPALVQSLAAGSKPVQTAAHASLVRLRKPGDNAAIAAELKSAKAAATREELIGILLARGAANSVSAILAAAGDADAGVRAAAVDALGQLAGPENVADMVQILLQAEKGPSREAVEKAVMLVCSRNASSEKGAEPLLAAFDKLVADDKTALLPTLGRVGGPAARKIVETAIADTDPQRREAGVRALCNWPDVSVAGRLQDLAATARDESQRTMALRALIRVAALPDKRSAAEKLALLKKAMTLAARDAERNLVLKRCAAVRTIESLRYVAPYMEKQAFAQQACVAVVELAHHRFLREPNKAEFDKALNMVIRTSKDATMIDRAKRYQKGQTLAPVVPKS